MPGGAGRGHRPLAAEKGLDEGKDQSYVLYNLTQEQLAISACRWGPAQERGAQEIAEQQHFINARKHDSQDICLCRMATMSASWKISPASATRQVIFWTRTAVWWAPTRAPCGTPSASGRGWALPWGHLSMSAARTCRHNTVTVGEEKLFDRIVYADEVNWIAIPELTGPLRVTARTRYHQVEQAATVYPAGEAVPAGLTSPSARHTPGQAVVLYQGDTVLGGGTITRVEK